MEASRAERQSFVDLSRLQPAEYFGFLAAGILFASLFLPWFSTDPENENSVIDGQRGDFNAFATFGILDWLLVAACSAPFILAYIIVRGHELSWRPGEVTAIVGVTAFVLILCNGLLFGTPGDAPEISLAIGWYVGLLAAGGIALSGFLRQLRGVKREPPGV